MEEAKILREIEKLVRQKFLNEGSGHDWWHIHRVRNTAIMLANKENADLFITEVAALLHDIADHKFHGGDLEVGPKTAADILSAFNLDQSAIEQIQQIIREVSFKGAGVSTPVRSIEAAVVQDADRLDAIGAIGIARAFAYGGHKGSLLYNPDSEPTMHEDFESYRTDQGSTINHFYEKLLLLKDRMQTASARREAQKRHDYMKGFLEQFFAEWNVNSDQV